MARTGVQWRYLSTHQTERVANKRAKAIRDKGYKAKVSRIRSRLLNRWFYEVWVSSTYYKQQR